MLVGDASFTCLLLSRLDGSQVTVTLLDPPYFGPDGALVSPRKRRPVPDLGDLAVVDRQVAGDRQPLEHPAVVGHQQEGAGVAVEGRFELLDGGQVEVVGRLVEDEQVHPAGLEQGQPGAGPLAGRQAAGRARDVVRLEAVLRQQGPDLGRTMSGSWAASASSSGCSPRKRLRAWSTSPT